MKPCFLAEMLGPKNCYSCTEKNCDKSLLIADMLEILNLDKLQPVEEGFRKVVIDANKHYENLVERDVRNETGDILKKITNDEFKDLTNDQFFQLCAIVGLLWKKIVGNEKGNEPMVISMTLSMIENDLVNKEKLLQYMGGNNDTNKD